MRAIVTNRGRVAEEQLRGWYNGDMARTPPSPFPFPPKRLYLGANIPMRVIRRYARAIAEEFHPDKIILFGSYAYGTPHEDSDVDLLVGRPGANPHSQSIRIHWQLAAPFPLDLIIRTPKEMKWCLEEGESFLTTIVTEGKVLYGNDHPGVGQKGGRRLRARQTGKPKQDSRT
jgi:predicted nucleotidyltransferase